MELGYFLAKMGRNRVCVLRQEGVEVPSDISGILYIELDAESSWKWKLARELKTAGLRIDLNNAE
jgi:predicted nucleotide-binding protein